MSYMFLVKKKNGVLLLTGCQLLENVVFSECELDAIFSLSKPFVLLILNVN
jgi:hypothetical protein